MFSYFQGYSLAYVGERVVVDLRRQTYEHLHRLSLRFFADRRVGELISRLSSDVTLVRTALTNNVATVLSQALTFAGSLALMLVLNWRLTLFILALAPLVGAAGAIFGRRLRRLSTQVQDQLADGTAMAEEALGEVRVVKAFAREPYEVQRYSDQMERTFGATMKLTRVRSAFGPLIAFLVYGINIAASIGAFTNLYTQIQEALGASRRIFELLDETPELRDAPNARPLPPVRGRIVFDRVSFAYPGTDRVLREIDLAIQPGEVLALVGPSGAGKSTLFNLILRFLRCLVGPRLPRRARRAGGDAALAARTDRPRAAGDTTLRVTTQPPCPAIEIAATTTKPAYAG